MNKERNVNLLSGPLGLVYAPRTINDGLNYWRRESR